ncbi:MAG: peptidoglycan-binding protein [Roseitalea sp.]|nr:peptidoglycan-binding protein [Roseitalea sp.]MBO6950999.1 peptidoglycan-binding protein [Rhizobiaceae bacterium]MBO6591014.1 peptidoglycan-binding protein [Roseitalea sp.]MBO6599728.1 peptidoglycan-binding protein [Roseitalea sp.]MBO6611484.1 peptidoglycan-binding protein [Roseitalea sp.]
MSSSDVTLSAIQEALADKGFYDGRVDGIYGPKTEAAIIAFKRSVGLRARPYFGPITQAKLFDANAKANKAPAFPSLVPWLNEIGKYIGRHESADYSILSRWLRSDGAYLGDPRRFPWCGDAVQTAIKRTLPSEPFPGRVGQNPYLARNWLDFGEPEELRFGVVVVLWRGSRSGMSGHVCFAIGYDPKRRRIRVRGGNQSNRVSDTWVREDRVLGYREPVTFGHELPPIPIMNSAGAVISTNEA